MTHAKRLLIAATTFFSLSGPSFGYNLPTAKEPPVANDRIALVQKISQGVADVAKASNGALVFISVSKTLRTSPMGMVDPFEFFFGMPGQQNPGGGRQAPVQKQEGLGSGFLIDLDKGYILTNNHVVEGADEIHIKLANGETHEGKVLGRDANTDLAVVQIKDKNFSRAGLTRLFLGNSDIMHVGDFVVALGAPYGLEASLSFGIVSATHRGTLNITKLGNFIQTDAAINPGNSGGPLINMEGEVIGVNSAIYSQSGGYAGIGFAIPSNLARTVAEELINGGKVERGYIGAQLMGLEPDVARDFNLPESTTGAVVTKVVEGAPAAKAGIQAGDVIIALDGDEIASETELVNRIGLMSPGKTVHLTLYRDGKKRDLALKVGAWPGDQMASAADESGESAYPFGLNLGKLTPFLKSRYGIESEHGAVVIQVEENSPARRAGLREGDLIVSVNGKKITSPQDFLKDASGKSRILARIERSGQFSYVSIRK